MNKIILIVALLIASAGCENNTQPEKAEQDKQRALALLPSDTIVVEDLGNKWFVVEIKKKKFLFGYWHGSHTETGFTITELKSED